MFTAAEIARHLNEEVSGDDTVQLTGFTSAENCKPGDLTFAENETYFGLAEQSAASAILVPDRFASTKKVLIRVSNARIACAKVLPLFFPPPQFAPGVHPSSVVADSAKIDAGAHIGPHCMIGERVRIGPRAVLEGGNYIGAECQVGEDAHLFPRVTLYARTQLGNR